MVLQVKGLRKEAKDQKKWKRFQIAKVARKVNIVDRKIWRKSLIKWELKKIDLKRRINLSQLKRFLRMKNLLQPNPASKINRGSAKKRNHGLTRAYMMIRAHRYNPEAKKSKARLNQLSRVPHRRKFTRTLLKRLIALFNGNSQKPLRIKIQLLTQPIY